MAATDAAATAALYDNIAELEANRLRLHPLERELTLDTIRSHLTGPAHALKLADIGGATGVYSFALAESLPAGSELHLRDLSPGLIALAQEEQSRRIADGRPTLASIGVGSAIDPALFPADVSGTFDAVLLLGPLYHLIAKSERVQALKYALDLLKPAGAEEASRSTPVVFAAFIMRAAHLRDIAVRDPSRLVRPSDAPFYAQYLVDGVYLRPGRQSYHVSSPDEVRDLVREAGGTLVALVGVESILGGDLDKALVDADKRTLDAWVDALRGPARLEANLGAADHWLAVVERQHPVLE